MKKLLSLILALSLALFVISAVAVDADLSFATQETGTAGYSYATAIQGVIQKVDGINVTLTTDSDGNVSSPWLIQNEDTDLTMSNSAPAKWAAEGGIDPPTCLPAPMYAASPAVWATTSSTSCSPRSSLMKPASPQWKNWLRRSIL